MIKITCKCDRCGRESFMTLNEFVNFDAGRYYVPSGWFDHRNQLFCDRHILVNEPIIKDVEEFEIE